MIPKFTVDVLTFVTATVHPTSIYYKNKVKKQNKAPVLGKASLPSVCLSLGFSNSFAQIYSSKLHAHNMCTVICNCDNLPSVV